MSERSPLYKQAKALVKAWDEGEHWTDVAIEHQIEELRETLTYIDEGLSALDDLRKTLPQRIKPPYGIPYAEGGDD